MDPKAYWVGFNYVKGIDAVQTRGIVDHFGDLESAWNEPIEKFEEIGIPAKILENIHQTRDQLDPEKISGNLVSKEIKLITWKGTHPYLKPQDVLELSNLEQVQEYKQACLLMPSDEIESRFIEVMESDSFPIDEITSCTGFTTDKVSATLTILELKSMVR
jgi:predicted Rossmann fold nucleotide-binding protein DprA/Smf involved in DNA uptake